MAGESQSTDDGLNQPRLAVLLSGSGRTLLNLIRAAAEDELKGKIVVVVSSKAAVRGIKVAEAHGIPVHVVDRRAFQTDLEFSEAIYTAIAPFAPHLILLAGFLRRIHLAAGWQDRILNIHPALLPDMAMASGRGYYGDRVHAAVLASGVKFSGATVHVVDEGYDTGRVVMREEVPVLPGDTVETLAARVFEAECRLYPRAINGYLQENRNLLAR